MKEFTLMELYGLKRRILNDINLSKNEMLLISDINEAIKLKKDKLFENTSATGGTQAGGMGAVVSAQPSGLAGQTIGPNWASNGGTTGSGDISAPYNPSGSNRVFQKIKAPMGKEHGARTGKKSREKKLDLKTIRDMIAKSKQDKDSGKKNSDKKVMNYNDFLKNKFTTIKK